MKKTLLIIALFIGLGNVNAQDSTNNATLEETIGFIAKYSEKIKSVKVCCLGEFSPTTFNKIYSVKITNENMIISLFYDKDDWILFQPTNRSNKFYVEKISIPLTKISSIGQNTDKSISTVEDDIQITGTYEINIYKYNQFVEERTKENYTMYTSNVELEYDYNEDLTPRLKKAFQHLEYLLIKKRKDAIDAERKASGDKF